MPGLIVDADPLVSQRQRPRHIAKDAATGERVADLILAHFRSVISRTITETGPHHFFPPSTSTPLLSWESGLTNLFSLKRFYSFDIKYLNLRYKNIG
jgi:hypothetical protein